MSKSWIAVVASAAFAFAAGCQSPGSTSNLRDPGVTKALAKADFGFAYDEPPEGDVGKMVVLGKGDLLKARNEYGELTVESISATRRKVTVRRIGEATREFTVDLNPRDESFMGLTGIYSGGHYGPRKADCSIQEGRLYLTSIKDLRQRLAAEPSMGYVVSEDGIAVGLFDPAWKSLNINIFEVYIDHKRVTGCAIGSGIVDIRHAGSSGGSAPGIQ